jgi:hypothetical protein
VPGSATFTGATGATGPAGPTQPATGTDLGAIQLAGDLTGDASAPYLLTYPQNMLTDISLYKFLGQSSLTGKTSAIPIAISTNGTIGPFVFAPVILSVSVADIGLNSAVGSPTFTAWGSGYVTRNTGITDVQSTTLSGVSITSTSGRLLQLSNPILAGCNQNESQRWDIYLKSKTDSSSYYLHLFFLYDDSLIQAAEPIFAILCGLTP